MSYACIGISLRSSVVFRWMSVIVAVAILWGVAFPSDTAVRVGAPLLRLLEAWYPRPSMLPDSISGVIVLGGGLDTFLDAHGAPHGPGERINAALELASRLPRVTFLFSGRGDADRSRSLLLLDRNYKGAALAECRSRDTAENAVFSALLAAPVPGQRWVLVTSAFHMPRAAAAFRTAGFEIVPYPVDYRIYPAQSQPSASLDHMKVAFRELAAISWYHVSSYVQFLLRSSQLKGAGPLRNCESEREER